MSGLHPASFAMVMAGGIVSIAAQLRGMPDIAIAFLWLNLVLYAVLWLLTVVLVEALNLTFLDIVPRGFVFIALAAWALTFLGLVWRQVELLKAG